MCAPVLQVFEVLPPLWMHPPAILLSAVDRLLHTKRFACQLSPHELLVLVFTQVPALAPWDTLKGVTQALIADTTSFNIETLRLALEVGVCYRDCGLTGWFRRRMLRACGLLCWPQTMASMDPLPRLTLRCFVLAITIHKTSTVAVIVQSLLDKLMLSRKPWLDTSSDTWKGIIVVIKQLLPGSNKCVITSHKLRCWMTDYVVFDASCR